jgi:hypothetical protein
VSARNRRQRAHARELREHALLHRHVAQSGAMEMIRRSREKLGWQVTRSKRMASRAKRKAILARERAQSR